MSMIHSKDYYRKSAPNGWQWVGCGDLPFTHIYSRGNYTEGFQELECSEECLTNGNLEFMAEHGLTMTKALLKKESKRLQKASKAHAGKMQQALADFDKDFGILGGAK